MSIWLTGLVFLAAFMAGTTHAGAANTSQLRISANQIGATQRLEVSVAKSVIVDLPLEAFEVIVSEPGIANAIMRTRSRAIVQGNAIGETNVFFLDASGRKIAVIEISVVQDTGGLAAMISRLLPGNNIQVQGFGQRIVLAGTANSADDVAKAVSIAGQFAGNPDNVVSVVNITGAQQVMLKVTVAEVQRESVKQLGIDLNATFASGGLTTGLLTNPGLGGASGVINSNSLGIGLEVGNFAVEATISALERRGALRTLAEPTLTALSGKQAQFLAGGEFPVPVGIDDGEITFEFKRFGVDLTFTPTVLSNGIIALDVDTIVIELSTEGGFSAGGITIPATKERRARTSVQLPSGGTLAIAGLIEDKTKQQFNALPGIGNVPILGALFRSRDFIHQQTELLILVTPYLTSPGRANQFDLPTDSLAFSGDAEAVFLGNMGKIYGVGGNGPVGDYQGNVGFILD
ncbi:MAG: type II and III secretion system protein family protein [Alphaproteobacteria bacterium]|nr:type II and III secretion system protein family protein [Alphaproteobacteria bacterium]